MLKTGTGFLFPRTVSLPSNKIRILRAENVACPSVFSTLVKKYAELAGLDPAVFSGHSLRAGLATSAAMAGASERVIMRQTRHKSEAMVRRYVRDANLFNQNVSGIVGL